MPLPYISRRAFLQVRDRLSDAASHDDIALETGLPLATIEGIADGSLSPSRIAEDYEHPLWEDMQSASRCTGCGAMVFAWPCLACQMAGQTPQVREPAMTPLRSKYKRGRLEVQRRRNRAA